MIYSSKENRRDYSSPLLGNGDIALWADPEGSVWNTEDQRKKLHTPKGCVFRAGRRTAFTHGQPTQGVMMQWGSLQFSCGSVVREFTQELDSVNGTVLSHCEYGDGRFVDTVCFVHPRYNLYAVQKTFHGGFPSVSLEFTLGQPLLEELRSLKLTAEGSAAKATMDVRAYDRYQAGIWLASTAGKVVTGEDRAVITHSAADGDVVCYYYLLEDSLYDGQFPASMEQLEKHILNSGFHTLLEENQSIWRQYHSEGFVQTNDSVIDAAYTTAMYHLKCYTTRWSIPVGLADVFWQGKYYGFDEYYPYLALLEGNKIELAKRVPQFRLETCLSGAINRATDYSHDPDMEQARFPWQTDEYGNEVASPGFWMDHVFHIAMIAVGAFEYYEYTMDRDFLKACYPLIRASAKFFTLNMLYEDRDGELYLGKCTDLERLGSSVFNPFFTSCGAINALEVCQKASILLDTDLEYGAECGQKAKGLRKTLPHDGEKYVPFDGSDQKSIAVFAGKYPFHVIDSGDPKMLSAMNDFKKYETTYGNMYPTGKRVSIWYASWKAVAQARAGLGQDACEGLMQATESLGPFAEVFEINEETQMLRPWFGTAAGVFLSAVQEMLLQSDGENIYLLPAAPEEWSNLHFKLAAKGGAIVEAEIQENAIKKLDISFRPGVEPKKFKVFFRGRAL
ncbi:MAG: hypothetical protein E7421_04175 [Ruminococcaceae bacterium]|nr:hypothetical protein [Oscillospiraceae bacterium]